MVISLMNVPSIIKHLPADVQEMCMDKHQMLAAFKARTAEFISAYNNKQFDICTKLAKPICDIKSILLKVHGVAV